MQIENKWQDRFDEKFVNGARLGREHARRMGEEIKSFIQSEIDRAVAEEREQLLERVKEYFTERIIEDLEVDFVLTKDEHTAIRIFEARKNRDELLNLIK